MKLPLVDVEFTDHELVREGWKREFVASEPRLSEMSELFISLGREVKITPTIEEVGEKIASCKACFESTKEATFTIWTRNKEVDN